MVVYSAADSDGDSGDDASSTESDSSEDSKSSKDTEGSTDASSDSNGNLSLSTLLSTLKNRPGQVNILSILLLICTWMHVLLSFYCFNVRGRPELSSFTSKIIPIITF